MRIVGARPRASVLIWLARASAGWRFWRSVSRVALAGQENLAESHLTRSLFGGMLRKIAALPWPAG